MVDFNNFSESSLKIINLAKEESRSLGHNFVGSEVLLLGLLNAGNGATQVLNAAGIRLESARSEVVKIIGRGSGYVSNNAPFTPDARRALETAISLACEQGFVFVEPEHLLLSIVELGDGFALKVIENLSASIPHLRDATMTQLQTLPRQPLPEQVLESETQSNLLPVIPPVSRTAPKLVSITTLPQETGRWVAEVSSSGSVLDGPYFKSIGYGDNDYKAIADALESLARMYRNFRAETD